ncbi:NlpC/P60 family protein [Corynebacterium pseudopelargi]|uniref:Putative endopeptidase n=1 Tax=Corynebacterium pseudopelargi TaxID=2080757 RepID=A0A3G6ITC5_9CORY|nr:C40 family peptidase [Corynebacterium pseudopelargi]AZA08903.1 putative endopeptidase precursor [Corynebacterium pseudopelargi]
MNSYSKRLIAAVSSSLLLLGLAPSVSADEVDALIQQMDHISHEASAKNEEVKQLQIDLERGDEKLEELKARAAAAAVEADKARDREQSYRQEVNRLAGSKYRGATIDPLSNALGADSPQYAIDRASYMSTLTRNANEALQDLREVTQQAAKKRSEADRSVAAVTYEQNSLKKREEELDRQQSELKQRTDEILDRVNALSPDQRARWELKNGPLPIDPAALSAAASGAVQAALSKLGAPYEWGAAGPDSFDCSGLVVWSFLQQGKQVPRTSQAQMAGGTPVDVNNLQPGDVVGYYPGATHVGIYIGDGKLVHASDYGIPVQVVAVDSMPIYGARRY